MHSGVCFCGEPGGGGGMFRKEGEAVGNKDGALESAEPTCVSTALSQRCSLVPGSSPVCFIEANP